MWARSSRSALSRRTLHYPKVIWTRVGINVGSIFEVGTISAYPSLSEGDLDTITRANEMWARSPRLALSRRTLHYPKVIWTTIGINVGTIVEVGTISAYLSLSKKRFGPTFAKLTFCEMELVQFRAMWALSEVNWAQN